MRFPADSRQETGNFPSVRRGVSDQGGDLQARVPADQARLARLVAQALPPAGLAVSGSMLLRRAAGVPPGGFPPKWERFLPFGRDTGGTIVYTQRFTYKRKVCIIAVSVAALPQQESGGPG